MKPKQVTIKGKVEKSPYANEMLRIWTRPKEEGHYELADPTCELGNKIIKALGMEKGKVEITIKRVKNYGRRSI